MTGDLADVDPYEPLFSSELDGKGNRSSQERGIAENADREVSWHGDSTWQPSRRFNRSGPIVDGSIAVHEDEVLREDLQQGVAVRSSHRIASTLLERSQLVFR